MRFCVSCASCQMSHEQGRSANLLLTKTQIVYKISIRNALWLKRSTYY